LFSFAPKPQACYRVKEPAGLSDWAYQSDDGYFELCCAMLNASSPLWNPAELHSKLTRFLDALERRRGCQTLTARLLKDVAQRRKAAAEKSRRSQVAGPKSKAASHRSQVAGRKSQVRSPRPQVTGRKS
jgi:hypothetical protein